MDYHIIWHQLQCTDLEPAIAFYEQLFGWTTRPEERTTYVHFYDGNDAIAGVMPQHGGGGPAQWGAHVGTSDIDAYCARAKAAGGKPLMPIMDIPHTGRLCPIADPGGAVLTAFQPSDLERKHWSTEQEVGHFCWFQLLCQDPAKSVAFYRDVVGWSAMALPMGDSIQHLFMAPGTGPEAAVGGAMQLPVPDAPDHFLPYVLVEDAGASVARAVELGGTMLCDSTPVPGYGRFAVLTDPEGAALAVFQPE
ncbi:VOC family protein [Saltatorellus ferox]